MSVCLERVVSKDYLDSFEGSSVSAMMQGQQEFARKAEVRSFLEQMVSNGKEREQMNELVEKFSKEFDVVGGFDDNKLYFEYVNTLYFCVVHTLLLILIYSFSRFCCCIIL